MLADRVSDILSLTGQSLKSLVKLAIQSQQPSIKNSDHKIGRASCRERV